MAPQKLTEAEEQFAMLFVRLGNARKAYALAYDVSKTAIGTQYQNAHVIKNKPHVKRRIEKYRKEKIESAGVSPEMVVQKHIELFEECRESEDYASATRNLTKVGETMGIYKDNLMVTGDLREVDDEELHERIVAALQDCDNKDMVKKLGTQLQSLWSKLKDEN